MGDSLDPRIAAAVEQPIVGAHVGLRCESIETDRVRVRLPFRREVTTIREAVHGGAIASPVDVAATAAAWAHPRAAPPRASRSSSSRPGPGATSSPTRGSCSAAGRSACSRSSSRTTWAVPWPARS